MIDTTSDEAFRLTIRTWIDEQAPEGLRELADWSKLLLGGGHWWEYLAEQESAPYKEWEQRLLAEHLVCAHWPEEYGGRGLSIRQAAIFDEECLRANVPRVQREQGEAFVGPAIIVHGTNEQKARLLGEIVAGRAKYAQGFSEPDHGSDLAALSTRGEIDGEQIVINGQKIWTTAAMHANRLFVLCRTNAEAPKHKGISYVIVDLADNVDRIQIQPIRQMTGDAEFCSTFFDNAVAPTRNIIGGVDNGWRVAMTTLGNERAGRVSAKYLVYEQEFWSLVDVSRGGGALSAVERQALARCYSRLKALQSQAWRLAAKVNSGGDPGIEASLDKLAASEYHRDFGELAMAMCGAAATVLEDESIYSLSEWQRIFLGSRSETIVSGTSEVQRNVLAERFLGMPRDTAPTKRSA